MKVKLNGNDFFELTSKFGVTDGVHLDPHTGIDLAMGIGTKLFSPTDGVVSRIVDYGSENIGKGIIIKTDSGENVIMGHLSDIKVKIGQTIHEGDFVALSGSTGHSTGGHLHLGLADASGNFLNPDKFIDAHGGVVTKLIRNKGHVHEDSVMGGMQNMWDFLKEWKQEGFFHAMYGKSFFEVCTDFFGELAHDIGNFLLGNGDLFFLMPAILIMFGTFIIGRNKYTKWIIPLWFAYFVTSFFHNMIQ